MHETNETLAEGLDLRTSSVVVKRTKKDEYSYEVKVYFNVDTVTDEVIAEKVKAIYLALDKQFFPEGKK